MNSATALALDAAPQAAGGGAPFPPCPGCGQEPGRLKLTRFGGAVSVKFVTWGHHLRLAPDEARCLPLKSWPPPYLRRYGPPRESEAALVDALADALLAGDSQSATDAAGVPLRIVGDRPNPPDR